MQTLVAATQAGDGPSNGDRDYIDLARQVRLSGLMERRGSRYVVRIGLNACALVGGWLALAWVGNSGYVLVVAAFLGLVGVQSGFIGHDAGHRQISSRPMVNHLVGLTHANLAIGMSYGYWVSKHNAHHSHPNDVDRDPDVAPGPFAWTTEQAVGSRGPLRWFARHQGLLFFPITLLEGFNMHVFSVRNLRSKAVRYRRTETILLLAHFAGYLGAVFLILSPLRAVEFIAVQQGLFGLYLGCAFAPNHKGMAMPVPGGDPEGFAARQVLTTRNIVGGRLVSIAFGGLNYQIEHHLFPTMPMRSLRRVQPLIREFCGDNGYPYTETTTLASYRMVVRYLRAVGSPLRAVLAQPPS